MQFIKQVRERLCSTHNVIDICWYPGLYSAKDIVYLTLNVCYQVDLSYYRDLEGLLTVVCYDGKYETMIKMEVLLVKK